MRYLLCFAFLIPCVIRAQEGNLPIGGRNAGIGGTSVTISDAYSVFNNVGTLGDCEDPTAFAGYQNRFGIASFQSIVGGFVYPTQWFTSSLGFYRFGDDLFNQQRISIAIGNKIQWVSLGLGASVIQYSIEGLQTKRILTLEFGGQVELLPTLILGGHIFNLQSGNGVPTSVKAGLSYRPSKNLMVNLETQKSLDAREQIKAGIEYQVIEPLSFRTGFSTHPFKCAFGFGFQLKLIQLDYAYTVNQLLGAIHDVSLAYTFKK